MKRVPLQIVLFIQLSDIPQLICSQLLLNDWLLFPEVSCQNLIVWFILDQSCSSQLCVES